MKLFFYDTGNGTGSKDRYIMCGKKKYNSKTHNIEWKILIQTLKDLFVKSVNDGALFEAMLYDRYLDHMIQMFPRKRKFVEQSE